MTHPRQSAVKHWAELREQIISFLICLDHKNKLTPLFCKRLGLINIFASRAGIDRQRRSVKQLSRDRVHAEIPEIISQPSEKHPKKNNNKTGPQKPCVGLR